MSSPLQSTRVAGAPAASTARTGDPAPTLAERSVADRFVADRFVPDRFVADRFVAFAFAAADLLVETDLDGQIIFATGAFRSRLGGEADSYLGRPIAHLFASSDGSALEEAMSEARGRGRMAPVVLHLANQAGSAAALAAILMPSQGDRPARMCFTIGPIPSPARARLPREPGLTSAGQFSRIAEEALRTGRESSMGLIEVKGLGRGRLSAAAQEALDARIDKALTEGSPSVNAGQLGDGRFGVISPTEIDIGAVVCRLEAALQETPGHGGAKAEGITLELCRSHLTTAQAARALRYALGRFVEGGTAGASAAGGTQGLAGIIATAETRARGLRETIAARRFRLAYQPVVSLADRKTHHFEALLRPIPTPNSPVQSTQDFVTFAEAVGLSEELDWAVLETAIEALTRGGGVSIAVNMSGLSMQNPTYRDRLLERVRGLRPILTRPGTSLLIELTETAEIDDMAGAATTIDALRAAGVAVCLDDFGAGSAALRYLRAFSVDFVKIDGVYVRGAETNLRDRGFVTSIVELADQAGAKVVAEMIETPEQAAVMRAAGVQFGQGWLYGRPGMLPGQL
jgi:EAL domain-containing protein (putative c-di-GMP-specific phosphodiesterase class I)